MTLYEINEQIEALTEQLVDEETGEINEEILEQLESLDMDREEKLENYGIVMKNLKAEIESINAEIKALTSRRNAKANRLQRMGEYVKYTLGGKTFESSKVAFGYRASKRVEIVNEELVPDEWCRFETTRKPVKTEIKKALADGQEVPGCVLVEEQNLQVK